MATKAETLKRMEKGFRQATGMEEDKEEKKEGPGIMQRLFDTLSEKVPEKKEEDPRLKKHQESIRKEIPTTGMVEPGKEEEVGADERSRKMRRLMLGLERPKKA